MAKKPTRLTIKETKSESSFLPPNVTSPVISIPVSSLPSRGLCYSGNPEISYRPLTFGEIAVLAESKMSPLENIDFLLNCLKTSFDQEQLTISDFLYLCLLMKMSTCETPKISASHYCTKCNSNSKFVFSLEDLSFADLEVPELPVVWKSSLKFSPLTIARYKELVSLGKEEDPLYFLAASCVSLSIEEAHEMVFNSTPKEAKTLKKIDKFLYHGVEDYEFSCANLLNEAACGNTVKVSLVGGEGNLQPFRNDTEDGDDDITFG